MEQKKSGTNKWGIAAVVIACISLCVSVAAFKSTGQQKDNEAGDGSIQYVMYVGTNDKDTYKPEHSEEEARDIVDQICLKYFEGYTLQDATGSWTDEKSNITHEYTLVCYFDDADKETVYKAADDIRRELNQNTILIEQDYINIDFYSGE